MRRRSGSSPSRVTIAAVALAILATACPGDAPGPVPTPTGSISSPGAQPGGSVTVAYPHEPPTLDPFSRAGQSPATRDLTRLLMPGLYRVGPGGARRLWLLAEEPEVREGPPYAVRVRLRDDAVWSDGRPITVEDLIFTWRHVLQARGGIPAADGYDRISRIVAESDRVGRIEFSSRFPQWANLFSAGLGVLPAHAVRGDARALSRWPVSGGPFVLAQWRRGLDVVLERNPRAWGDPALLDRLRIVFVPDAIGALELFRRGEVDVLGPYQAPDWQRRVSKVPGASVSAETAGTWAALLFDTREAPFADVRVRRALAYAIDRARIAQGLVGTEGAPLESLARSPGSTGPFARYREDVARARRLLRDAGWTGSPPRRDGADLDPTLALIGDDLPWIVARAVQFQSQRAGFDVQAVGLDAERFWGEWLDGPEMRAALVVWRAPSPGAVRARLGVTGSDEDLASLVRALPLYAVSVGLVAAEGIAGLCASSMADGPFWNAHTWTRGSSARAASCPTTLDPAA